MRGPPTVPRVRYRAELAVAVQLLGTAVRSAGLALEHVAGSARCGGTGEPVRLTRRIARISAPNGVRLERDLHDGAQRGSSGCSCSCRLAAEMRAEGKPNRSCGSADRQQAPLICATILPLRTASIRPPSPTTGLMTACGRSPPHPRCLLSSGETARRPVRPWPEATATGSWLIPPHTLGGLTAVPAIRATVDGDEAMLGSARGRRLGSIKLRRSGTRQRPDSRGQRSVPWKQTAVPERRLRAEFPSCRYPPRKPDPCSCRAWPCCSLERDSTSSESQANADELLAIVANREPTPRSSTSKFRPRTPTRGCVGGVILSGTPRTAVPAAIQRPGTRYAEALLNDHPAGSGYLLRDRVYDAAAGGDALRR